MSRKGSHGGFVGSNQLLLGCRRIWIRVKCRYINRNSQSKAGQNSPDEQNFVLPDDSLSSVSLNQARSGSGIWQLHHPCELGPIRAGPEFCCVERLGIDRSEDLSRFDHLLVPNGGGVDL